MQYLMVTSFDGHWDRMPNGRTYYTLGMINWDINKKVPIEDAGTIFIKIHKFTKKFEKCWQGKVFQFEKVATDKTRIYFKVKIDKTIPCPRQYFDRPEGWYEINSSDLLMKDGIITAEDIKKLTIPQLFTRLSIGTWIIFLILVSVAFQAGYNFKAIFVGKTIGTRGDVNYSTSEINRFIENHNENMKKLYESIVEEEHRAGLAKDPFEEGQHKDSIDRLKVLLEKEKQDFKGEIADILKSNMKK